MTLLQQRDAARRRRRFELWEETRRQLRSVLAELIPGHRVIVFGSLTRPGVFNDRSDVDLALLAPLPAMDPVTLTGALMEPLGRPVDVVSGGQPHALQTLRDIRTARQRMECADFQRRFSLRG